MVKRLALGAALGVACSLDPVPDQRAADLGDEAPGVAPGPLHRAGQPCLACHDEMSIAGTVYAVRGSGAPLANAQVHFTDNAGSTATALSNAAGNFYLLDSQWRPTFPVRVEVDYGTVKATMNSIIGRDGSCATCHLAPSTRISPGPIYVAPASELLPDAGSR